MRGKLLVFPTAPLLLIIPGADTASAACPVCVGTAAGGTALGKWLGLSDPAIGIWNGVLVSSLAL